MQTHTLQRDCLSTDAAGCAFLFPCLPFRYFVNFRLDSVTFFIVTFLFFFAFRFSLSVHRDCVRMLWHGTVQPLSTWYHVAACVLVL